MYYYKTDLDYIHHLKATIASLRAENERLREESRQYLDKWVAAQDLASHRNLLLALNK